jgi:ABC-type Zn uptake system ZnuABC Zn-binding protein ZnuA
VDVNEEALRKTAVKDVPSFVYLERSYGLLDVAPNGRPSQRPSSSSSIREIVAARRHRR